MGLKWVKSNGTKNSLKAGTRDKDKFSVRRIQIVRSPASTKNSLLNGK
jgi:hypothetical protein